MAYNSAYTGAQVDAAVGAVRNKETTWDSKQNALSGTEDQLVGFNASGEAAAVPMPSAADVGADPAGTAEEKISEHNASSSAHATLFEELSGKIPAKPKYVTVTLFASAWSNDAQTVTVNGVLADETKQLIQPMPAMASQSAYYGAEVLCSGQAANSLTFTCSTVPSSNLTVYVVMQEVGA